MGTQENHRREELKQLHKNKELATGLEILSDLGRGVRMVDRRRQSESLD